MSCLISLRFKALENALWVFHLPFPSFSHRRSRKAATFLKGQLVFIPDFSLPLFLFILKNTQTQEKRQSLEWTTGALGPSLPSLLFLSSMMLKSHTCSKWNPDRPPGTLMLSLTLWLGMVFRAWNRPGAHLSGRPWQGRRGVPEAIEDSKGLQTEAHCEELELWLCTAWGRKELNHVLQIGLYEKTTRGLSCADWLNLNENH